MHLRTSVSFEYGEQLAAISLANHYTRWRHFSVVGRRDKEIQDVSNIFYNEDLSRTLVSRICTCKAQELMKLFRPPPEFLRGR